MEDELLLLEEGEALLLEDGGHLELELEAVIPPSEFEDERLLEDGGELLLEDEDNTLLESGFEVVVPTFIEQIKLIISRQDERVVVAGPSNLKTTVIAGRR